MAYFRDLALGGIDGTGSRPIPFAVHTQALAQPSTQHMPSESEVRLNYFSAWAFGCKLVCAFTYTNPANPPYDYTMLFEGPTDEVRSPWFNLQAEVNRQSLNLGPALVRLLTTDVRWLPGRGRMGGSVQRNPVPRGIKQWQPWAGPHISRITRTATWRANEGMEGDVIVGYFKPLLESFDGDQHENEVYFMIVNGLTTHEGPAHFARQMIHLEFDFGDQAINSIQRLNRDTGAVEVIPLAHDGGARYHLDFILDGGDGDLFKFNTGSPFVGVDAESPG